MTTPSDADTAAAIRLDVLAAPPAPVLVGTLPDAWEVRALPPLSDKISAALVSWSMDLGPETYWHPAGARWYATVYLAQHWQGRVICAEMHTTGNHDSREDAEAEVLRQWENYR